MVGTYNHPQAKYGRNGDKMMAHVTPGEMVVPKPVMDANPALALHIAHAIMSSGADPSRYRVGKDMSINPKTGKPEFGFFFGRGGIFGGHGGFLGNPITRTASEIAASFIPVVGPYASAAIGATAGGTGAGQQGSGSIGGALTGGLEGYGIGAGTQAVAGALGSASGASGANLAAGAAGPVTSGLGTAQVAGNSLIDTAVGAASPLTKTLSALGSASSLFGQPQQQQALANQQISNPTTTTSPFAPVKPAAMAAPSSLSELSTFSPEQTRSALATQGINGGLGSDEQAYYRNLLQRSLIGDGNKVDTSNPNFLMPIESQYFSQQGQNTSDVMKFLQGIQS